MKIALSGLASTHVDQWISHLARSLPETDSSSVETRAPRLFALAQTMSRSSDATYGAQQVRADSFNRTLGTNVPFLAASPQSVAAQLASFERSTVQERKTTVSECSTVAVGDRHVGAHYEQAAELLDRGFHVFVDKPFVSTPQQATDLVDRARSNGVMVSSASALRFHPVVQWLQKFRLPGGQPPEFTIRGGADWQSPFGGPWFYGVHAIELGLALGADAIGSWQLTESGHLTDVKVSGPWTGVKITSRDAGQTRTTHVQIHADQSQPFTIFSEHLPQITAELAQVPHLAGTYTPVPTESRISTALQLQLGSRYMWPLIDAWFGAVQSGRSLVPESQLLAAVSIAHAAWGDPPAPVAQVG